MISVAYDPTAYGDRVAAKVRTWYEANRESWWSRHWWGLGAGPDRAGVHADEFMLGLLNAVYRADQEVRAEINKR
jgi:hypothetical protein